MLDCRRWGRTGEGNYGIIRTCSTCIYPAFHGERSLAPYAVEIESGDFSRVHPLLKAGKSYVTDGLAVFNNFRIVISNLHFIILAFAHRAKHFDSFAAGEKFLRAASIVQRFTRNFFHIGEDDVDTLLEYLEDGLEELMIAADYAKLPDWERYVAAAKGRIAK